MYTYKYEEICNNYLNLSNEGQVKLMKAMRAIKAKEMKVASLECDLYVRENKTKRAELDCLRIEVRKDKAKVIFENISIDEATELASLISDRVQMLHEDSQLYKDYAKKNQEIMEKLKLVDICENDTSLIPEVRTQQKLLILEEVEKIEAEILRDYLYLIIN